MCMTFCAANVSLKVDEVLFNMFGQSQRAGRICVNMQKVVRRWNAE